jgi:hypothetical protein
MRSTIFKEIYDNLIKTTKGSVPVEQIQQVAMQQTELAIERIQESMGVGQRPQTQANATPQLGGQMPPPRGMPPPAAQGMQPTAPSQQVGPPVMKIDDREGGHDIDMRMLNALPQADRAIVMNVINRYQMNPNEGTKRAMEQAMAAVVGKLGPQTDPAAAAPRIESTLPRKDPRQEAFDESYYKGEGASMQKALDSTTDLISSNSGLTSTLNVLDGVFANSNVPSGEWAKLQTKAQSALSSIGIDIGGATGAAQIAEAFGNQLALKMRTSGGSNLMPGAMSNFDAQMLQTMVPTLSQTAEGRKAMVSLTRTMAESQIRIAKEAQKFAQANGGVLTPEWRAQATKLEEQEMVKREMQRRKIMKQLGGK